MSIKKRIGVGGALLAGAFFLQTTATTVMEQSLSGASENQRLMASAIHNHMQ